MKKPLDNNVIRDVALELGVDPSFIEKDWYAVQILALVSELQSDSKVKMVFAGGTSLAKGYGLIKRFSEDLDFILTSSDGSPLSVGQRRNYRKAVVSAIQHDARFRIDEDAILCGDSHRFFKIPIQYDRIFIGSFLRPYLQLEMTFTEPKQLPRRMSIHSLVSEVARSGPELEIDCVSAIETAGDKLSALTWRVLVRDRANAKDDPTTIRHLHDLAVLESMVTEAADSFVSTARGSLEQDNNRRGGDVIAGMAVADRLISALNVLKEDHLYQKEYTWYVESMSYGAENEVIGFEQALQALERIIALYLRPSASICG